MSAPIQTDASGLLRLWPGPVPEDGFFERLFLYRLDGGVYGVLPRYRNDGTRAVDRWYVPLRPDREPSHAAALARSGRSQDYQVLAERQRLVAPEVPAALAQWQQVRQSMDDASQAQWLGWMVEDTKTAARETARYVADATGDVAGAVGKGVVTAAVVYGAFRYGPDLVRALADLFSGRRTRRRARAA